MWKLNTKRSHLVDTLPQYLTFHGLDLGISTLCYSSSIAVPSELTEPPMEDQIAWHTLWPQAIKLSGYENELSFLRLNHGEEASCLVRQGKLLIVLFTWFLSVYSCLLTCLVLYDVRRNESEKDHWWQRDIHIRWILMLPDLGMKHVISVRASSNEARVLKRFKDFQVVTLTLKSVIIRT